VWINVLCYAVTAVGFFFTVVKFGDFDSDPELAAFLGLSFLIGFLWVAILPFGLLWLFLWGVVRLARSL
jgi:hypothetical protein